MKSKLISSNGAKTYAVIFEAGEEAVSGLSQFAKENSLGASRLTAIGGFQDAVLGYFELEKKDYKKIPIDEQVEVLSLVGDITLDKGEPKLHVHAVVGTSNGMARGGHLIQAHVRPTLEVLVTESPKHLHREHDEATGLALIRL
ncbi:MAG TPA: PPC domain-containing DNA-binding protein [Terriglobia bacterium]|nr:PPC domain-containing DNA-binding protein [Terriglobia bacterium]